MIRSDLDRQIAEELKQRENLMSDEFRSRFNQALLELPLRQRTSKRRTAPFIGFGAAAILIILSIMVTFGTSTYAEAIKEKLQSIFAFAGDEGLADVSKDKEPVILAQKTDKGYTLQIQEVQFDGMRLSFSYYLSHPDGIAKMVYVQPSFVMDPAFKKQVPGVMVSDGGGVWGADKIGIVSYYFNGLVPTESGLDISVKQLSLMDNNTNSSKTVYGDWSFHIPIEKAGKIQEKTYGTEYARSQDEVHFNIVKTRFASRTAEWNFHWELPNKWVPNAFVKDAPSYGLKYSIIAGNKQLAIITSVGKNRIQDRKLPENQWIYINDDKLFTEPLPKGVKKVTVRPILITFSEGKSAEKPLTPFIVDIPVESE